MVRQTDLIWPDEAGNLSGLFHERVRRTPERAAYSHFDVGSQRWLDTSWFDMAIEVGRWQVAMNREGLQPGDRVAVMLRNSREWVIFDQAALGLGLVTVPLYPDDRPDNVAQIVEETGVRLLVVNGRHQWRRLQEVKSGFDSLKRIISLSNIELGDGARDTRLVSFDEWVFGCRGEPQRADAGTDDLASIVYTSGTAGRPKGVMLTHGNLLGNAWAVCDVEPLYSDDVFLSFLPLSHTLERTGGYYFPMFYGARVAFARSVQQLGEDLRAVRPTVLISVPRVYERLHSRIAKAMSRKSSFERLLFNLTLKVGEQRYAHSLQQAVFHPREWLWPMLDRLVAAKIRTQLGGRLRFAVCGGAALSPRLAREFSALGIPVLQGYGLTEASPVVSVNRPADNRFESIGVPLKGVEVRLGTEGELEVRGPYVMQGYWKDAAATRRVLAVDGWLRTGDQVRQDEAGRLYITGRLKDIIVLSNGEKVSPSDMETAIGLDELFDQVLVAGEGQAFLSALVVLNAETWRVFAAECDVDPMDPESLLDRFVERRLLQRIGSALHDFPGYAQIRRLRAFLEPWTLEEGLMTPTQKLKRAHVLAMHRDDLRCLYEGE